MSRLPFVVAAVLVLCGCINSKADSGVANVWRDPDGPAFELGSTTQSQVADALGPPSQVIVLEAGVVFYYLMQSRKTQGFILLLYNQTREQVFYDRAVFFFDSEGVLEDYALSLEQIEYEPPQGK